MPENDANLKQVAKQVTTALALEYLIDRLEGYVLV
jgi:hypothetical protein